MTEPTTKLMTPPWVIIGCGRLGTALTYLAGELDISVRAAWDRDGPPQVPADQKLSGSLDTVADMIGGAALFITVADQAISSVAAVLAPHCGDAEVVVHCSGSISSNVLREAGITAPVGSVHPLLSVADPEEAVERLADAAWTVEGTRPAVWWARGWLTRLGVEPTDIDPDFKALYHAAAVASSGLVVGLMDLAFEFAERAGTTSEQARQMLLPLAESTIANLANLAPDDALTGPVARGDDEVVEAHLEAIAALDDANALAIYEALTERTRRLLESPREVTRTRPKVDEES